MIKFFFNLSLALSSTVLLAEIKYAPENSTWTRIESVQVSDNQIDFQGNITSSADLNASIIVLNPPMTDHCIRSMYMMLDKPGKYQLIASRQACTLKVVQ